MRFRCNGENRTSIGAPDDVDSDSTLMGAPYLVDALGRSVVLVCVELDWLPAKALDMLEMFHYVGESVVGGVDF